MKTIDVIRDVKPDVVLFDASPPRIDYVEAVRLIKRHSPNSRTLLLISAKDEAEICRALKAGAKGYVSKNAGLTNVIQAIHGVHRGDVWVERKLIVDVLCGAGPLASPQSDRTGERPNGDLTVREQEILRQLASGGTNRHIAEALYISEKTVKTHLNSIFRKLNVRRRLQAVVYAIQQGFR